MWEVNVRIILKEKSFHYNDQPLSNDKLKIKNSGNKPILGNLNSVCSPYNL